MFTCLLAGTDVLTVAAVLVVGGILIVCGCLWFFFMERSTGKDRKSNPTDDEEDFEIKISRYVIGTMLVLTSILGAFAALCLILYLAKADLSLETTVLATCIFGGAALIFAIFSVLLIRWRVTVRGERITFIPPVGKKREFSWDDISRVEKIAGADNLIKVYFNADKKPAFTLNGIQTGIGIFIKRLQKSGKIFL